MILKHCARFKTLLFSEITLKLQPVTL